MLFVDWNRHEIKFILSYLVLSHLISSHLILSYLTLPYLTLSYLILRKGIHWSIQRLLLIWWRQLLFCDFQCLHNFAYMYKYQHYLFYHNNVHNEFKPSYTEPNLFQIHYINGTYSSSLAPHFARTSTDMILTQYIVDIRAFLESISQQPKFHCRGIMWEAKIYFMCSRKN